jgi:predicted 2-oxoglutarate/Fe(II)-dependent dioxygenase YbiX
MNRQPQNHKPHEKMPEHLSTNRKLETKEEKIDAQMEDTFPASDPPSYSGGNHIVGAPSGRESDAQAPAAVADAKKKVKNGAAAKPEKY